MKHKFPVGTRVKVVAANIIGKKPMIGKVVTIKSFDGTLEEQPAYILEGDSQYRYKQDELMPLDNIPDEKGEQCGRAHCNNIEEIPTHQFVTVYDQQVYLCKGCFEDVGRWFYKKGEL